MKAFALWSAILALGLTLTVGDAEAARRLGGGRSFGMQREAVSPQKSVTPAAPPAAPNQSVSPMTNRAQQPAAAPQTQPRRSWMGPLAGLAAGLGLAALASHFGFGGELASLLMMGLLFFVVLAVVGFFMRRRAGVGQYHRPAMAGAGHVPRSSLDEVNRGYATSSDYAGTSAASVAAGSSGHIPAGFDVEAFVRNAKVNFLRLQAANDAGNLEDIREFATPEMFAEIKLNMAERGHASQQTDVESIDVEVLDVAEEGSRYVASVRFHGLIREDRGAAEPFDEVWHMVKPKDGSRGWVLAGIQQVQ